MDKLRLNALQQTVGVNAVSHERTKHHNIFRAHMRRREKGSAGDKEDKEEVKVKMKEDELKGSPQKAAQFLNQQKQKQEMKQSQLGVFTNKADGLDQPSRSPQVAKEGANGEALRVGDRGGGGLYRVGEPFDKHDGQLKGKETSMVGKKAAVFVHFDLGTTVAETAVDEHKDDDGDGGDEQKQEREILYPASSSFDLAPVAPAPIAPTPFHSRVSVLLRYMGDDDAKGGDDESGYVAVVGSKKVIDQEGQQRRDNIQQQQHHAQPQQAQQQQQAQHQKQAQQQAQQQQQQQQQHQQQQQQQQRQPVPALIVERYENLCGEAATTGGGKMSSPSSPSSKNKNKSAAESLVSNMLKEAQHRAFDVAHRIGQGEQQLKQQQSGMTANTIKEGNMKKEVPILAPELVLKLRHQKLQQQQQRRAKQQGRRRPHSAGPSSSSSSAHRGRGGDRQGSTPLAGVVRGAATSPTVSPVVKSMRTRKAEMSALKWASIAEALEAKEDKEFEMPSSRASSFRLPRSRLP
jgi:hypothetical protein